MSRDEKRIVPNACSYAKASLSDVRKVVEFLVWRVSCQMFIVYLSCLYTERILTSRFAVILVFRRQKHLLSDLRPQRCCHAQLIVILLRRWILIFVGACSSRRCVSSARADCSGLDVWVGSLQTLARRRARQYPFADVCPQQVWQFSRCSPTGCITPLSLYPYRIQMK